MTDEQVLCSFQHDDTGHACDSVYPVCCLCEGRTRSGYTTQDLAETAAKNLGWAPTAQGYVCAECLQRARQEKQ